MKVKDQVQNLENELNSLQPIDVLKVVASRYEGKVAFSTSLGVEDQVITDLIAKIETPIRIFTLDTGRLFQETYDLIHITETKYNRNIELFFPDSHQVEQMVKQKGVNLFYESVENRKECCHVRKILPLRRALDGVEVWITGLRRDQSVTRQNIHMVQWDESMQVIKINPLINWSLEETWAYIKQNHVPYNELHDKGFPSIGCLPCTRAILPGEDIRSGRWWWEMPENKECGLHKRSDR